MKIVPIVSPPHRPAPVSEVLLAVCLFFLQLHGFPVKPDKSGEAKCLRRLRLTGMVDTGNAQPALLPLLDEQEMVIAVVAVEEKAVVGQPPFTALELSDIPALDLDAESGKSPPCCPSP